MGLRFLGLFVTFLVIVAFQNCAQINSFTGQSDAPANQNNGNGRPYAGITIEGPKELKPGETANLVAVNAAPPVNFRVIQGSGSFSNGSGPYYQILRFEEGDETPKVVKEAPYSQLVEHTDLFTILVHVSCSVSIFTPDACASYFRIRLPLFT